MPIFSLQIVKRTEVYVEAETRLDIKNAIHKDWRFLDKLDFDGPEIDYIHEHSSNFKVDPLELVTINENGEFSI